MFSSKDLFFTPAAGGYTVSKSLRFRGSATAYLNRTPGSSGNRTTWTWSGWIKRGSLGSSQDIFDTSNGAGTVRCFLRFNSTDAMYFQFDASTASITTTSVYRDPSAWYHIVLAADSTQSTNTNRLRLYVNGVQVTTGTFNYPTLSANSDMNIASQAFTIGRYTNTGEQFDGYMAEVNFLDGYPTVGGTTYNATTWAALNVATLFGAYDTNGIWQPAAYTGSYGTNGFYLKYTTVGATSGSNTGYGQDFSGNGNYWTTNNFGTTSNLTTYDSMLDSPTNATGDIGNYAVANPLSVNSATITDGNLGVSISGVASAVATAAGTIGVSSGKWYWETTVISNTTSDLMIGVVDITRAATARNYSNANTWYYYGANGNKYISGTGSAYGASYTNNNVIGIALDMDNGTIVFYKDGASQGTAASTGISGLTIVPVWGNATSGGAQVYAANFGQRPFAYTPPSGFSALNTQNLSTPTITNGAQYMAAVTYTGNSSTQTITTSSTNSGNNPNGTSFQPDFVWIKNRSVTSQHVLTDVVRGVDRQLFSSLTNAEQTSATGITSFNSNGFSLGSNVSPTGSTNSSPDSFIAWEWKAGNSSGSSNTSGSITSTVSVNTTAGFSVVTYTSPNLTADQTVGHGLGVAPAMIIVKDRDTTFNWDIYHRSLSAGEGLTFTTAAASAGRWPTTAPTTTVFSTKNTYEHNGTDKYVAYCFAPVAGYSAFGSYTGNSSTDGTFVYTGFRPRYVLFKSTSGPRNWGILDSSRNTYNVANSDIYANLSIAEITQSTVDFLSNGFKLRVTDSDFNASGETYIYAAFAENPFKISRAR